MNTNEIQDPTKQGVGGLKGVNTKISKYRNIDYGVTADLTKYKQNRQQREDSPVQFVGTPEVGESVYDKGITSISELENLNETRAEQQPWYDKIAAGLTKGTVLAGTTFVDGTVGLIYGGISAASEGKISKLYDNPISVGLKSINDAMEETLPNYYTEHEQENPWSHVFSANFIGDKFIKNLGFTVGAFYSGGLATIPLAGAGKLSMMAAKNLGATYSTLKSMKAAQPVVNAIVGSSISSLNEGRIEALNNSTDWYELQKAKLDDEFSQRLSQLDSYKESEMYPDLVKGVETNYNTALTYLNEQKAKMGNVDMLMNYPILMASNLTQFGRLYANGFKTAKKTAKVFEKSGKFVGKPSYGMLQAGLAPLAEGTEEISQRAASTISGKYYEDKFDNFYKLQLDPNAEQETISRLKSAAEGINETVNDGSAWEEFFIGSLTGALGMPSFRGVTNKETNKKQSPIYFRGGIVGGIKDAIKENKDNEEMASLLNKRIQDPEFLNYYKGAIRRNKLQNVMDEAVLNNDEFGFKNAEQAQLISDIIMFDKAGKLDYLKTMIEEGANTSPENLQEIRKLTTTEITNEDGTTSIASPYIDDKGNALSDELLAKKITDNKNTIISAIDNYIKDKNELEYILPNNISDDETAELLWLKSQIKPTNDRLNTIAEENKQNINKILAGYNDILQLLNQELLKEGQVSTAGINGNRVFNITERYKDLETRIQNIKNTIDSLTFLSSTNNGHIWAAEESKKFKEAFEPLLKDIQKSNLFNYIDATTVTDLFNKWEDMIKLSEYSNSFNNKLMDYLNNPEKINSTIVDTTVKAAEESNSKELSEITRQLDGTTNYLQFAEVLDKLNNEPIKQQFLDSISNNKDHKYYNSVKNYKEINDYKSNVFADIRNSDIPIETKKDAINLFNSHIASSENLDAASNMQSIELNDQDLLYDNNLSEEDNLDKFMSAQYAVFKSMYKTNSDNKFKALFSNIVVYPLAERFEFRKTKTGNVTNIEVIAYRAGDGQQVTNTGLIVDLSLIKDLDISQIDAVALLNLKIENSNYSGEALIRYKDNTSVKKIITFTKNPITEQKDKAKQFVTINETIVATNQLDANNKVKENFIPIADSNQQKDYQEVQTVNDVNQKQEDTLTQTKGKKYYYRPTISQLHKDATIDKDYRPFDIVMKEKTGRDYSLIYNYLEKKNAFSFVNNGGLSVKDEIEFVIDPTLENSLITTLSGYSGYTILLRHKKSQTILGPLGGTEDALKSYNNLGKLRDVIIKEYESRSVKDNSIFASTLVTEVAQILLGKLPISDITTNLKDLPNLMENPMLAIVQNGNFITNGKVNPNNIIKLLDMSNKEGRLYLLIPNAKKKYTATPVRAFRFNSKELNFNNSDFINTPLGKELNDLFTELSTVRSQDDISKVMKKLQEILYTKDIIVTWYNSSKGIGLRINRILREEDGQIKKVNYNGKMVDATESSFVVFGNGKSAEQESPTIVSFGGTPNIEEDDTIEYKDSNLIKTDLINTFLSFNLSFQINTGLLNSTGYNRRLINSNVLTTNLERAEMLNSWFTVNPLEDNGTFKKAEIIKTLGVNPNKAVNNPIIPGELISLNNENYYINLTENKIYNSKGQLVFTSDNTSLSFKLSNDKAELLFDLLWIKKNIGNIENSNEVYNNQVLLPNGKILDKNTNTYLSEEKTAEIKTILENRKTLNKQTIKSNIPILPDALLQNYVNEKNEIVSDYMVNIGEVEGISIRVKRNPIYTKSLIKKDEQVLIAFSYDIVLPNGLFVTVIKQELVSVPIEDIYKKILKAVSSNPDRLKNLNKEETILQKTNSSNLTGAVNPTNEKKNSDIDNLETNTNKKTIGKTRATRTTKLKDTRKKELIDNSKQSVDSELQKVSNTSIVSYDNLTIEQQTLLNKDGITKEMFDNKLSELEKKKILDCLPLV